ncbi:MAG: hypothetical protein Tsb0010_12930 [Parvularculaceae bacterium]
MAEPALKFFVTDEQKEDLRKFIASGAAFVGAQVSYLNLEKYRLQLGDEWARLKKIIFAISRDVITECVERKCVVVETELKFLLLFFDAVESDIAPLVAEIGRKIDAALKHEDRLAGKHIACRTGPMSFAEFEADLNATANRPVRNAGPKPLKFRPDQAKNGEFSFMPVFMAAGGARFAEICAPTKLLSRKIWQSDESYFENCGEVKDLDIATFEMALFSAHKSVKAGCATKFIFSLNFNNLRSKAFLSEYECALRQTPERLKRLLIPRISRISSGAPYTALTSILPIIKRTFPIVAMEASSSSIRKEMEVYADLPILLVSASAQEIKRIYGASIGEKEGFRRIFNVSRQHKKRILIHSIDNIIQLHGALDAGVDLLSGGELCAARNKPSTMAGVKLPDVRLAG